MAIDGAVAAELKENGAWVPLTLAESVSARCGSNTTCKDSNSARNPQFSEIIGKLGHGEKESVNCGGSTKSTEGCRKVEFMIPGNSDFGQHQTAVEAPFETKMGTQLHNHNFRFEFGLDSTKASTISKNKTPKKSRLGLNKKSQKRLKMKRHRPKVFDETKPLKPSTPKLRTPKRGKYVKRDSPNTVVDPLKDVDREAVGDYEKESCRKKLDFDIENCIVNQNPKVCNGIGSETEVQHKQQSNSRFSSLIVYRRVFRCLKSSRKLGPNCPKMFKKARMRRQRATVFYKHISLVPFPRNQRTTMKEPMNFTPMVKDRKRESRSLNRSQKSSNACVTIDRISKEVVKLQESEMSTLNLAWKVNSKRKRSNSFTPRQDLSSFIIDLSKLQLSEAFLLKAACIRTRDRDKLSAGVEVQDDLVQNLVTKELTEQEELPRDDVFSCNENIQKCPTEYEDVILEVDMDLPVQNGEGSVVSSTKEMGSFSDNATSYLVGPHDVENNVLESQDYDALTEALVDFAVQRMEGLNIDDGFNQLVVRDQNAHGALVPSNGKFDPFKKRKEWPKVDLDVETKRVWNVLMEKGEDTEKEDDEKTKYWKEQRELYRGRVDSFIARMQLIQGDRRFSPWKGSVVDSVVGVFLTQNVSDHLSSSTFMSLTARFPPPSVSEDIVCDGRSCCAHDIHQVKTAEPTSDKCEELSTMEKDPSSCFSNQVGVDSENGRSCCVNDIQQVKTAEPPSDKCEESSPMEKDPSFCPSNPVGVDSEDGNKTTTQSVPTPRRKKGKTKDKQENTINWDDLRKQYSNGIPRNRTQDNMDSVDWEAVRRAPVGELAKVILERGMNNILAVRIKDFLDRIVRDHGSIDLEWLRDVPPDKAKEYLLSIPGLGLKSVECVRLLTLHHHAFPVDTNISRILVRLGWVPLQPLPEDVQIHLLEQYPLLDSIQKYIWPRLCDIEQPTMYECHCQLIACGKAICTKKQPNCNACPMRGECRHYASAFASAKSRLKGPGEENTPTQSSVAPSQGSNTNSSPPMLSYSGDDSSQGIHNSRNCEPIIEYPPSPEPEVLCTEIQESDIEDFGYESEIPTLDITSKEFIKDLLSSMDGEDDMSKALVALRPEVAAIPMPKLKDVKRLRTVHHVYELPDSHSLLSGFRKREPDDPCPYLLAIWTADDTSNAAQESRKPCNCDQSRTCASCSRETVHQHQNDQTVQGTILIPCRTANKGSFPLNGTYFQVNEVFADHKSSRRPIAVPREWIWNLRRRPLFCGTSLTAICRGMSLLEIAYFFCHGFICIRGVDGKTGSATPLARRFHVCKTRQIGDDE